MCHLMIVTMFELRDGWCAGGLATAHRSSRMVRTGSRLEYKPSLSEPDTMLYRNVSEKGYTHCTYYGALSVTLITTPTSA
jgi:hypothetical protein